MIKNPLVKNPLVALMTRDEDAGSNAWQIDRLFINVAKAEAYIAPQRHRYAEADRDTHWQLYAIPGMEIGKIDRKAFEDYLLANGYDEDLDEILAGYPKAETPETTKAHAVLAGIAILLVAIGIACFAVRDHWFHQKAPVPGRTGDSAIKPSIFQESGTPEGLPPSKVA